MVMPSLLHNAGGPGLLESGHHVPYGLFVYDDVQVVPALVRTGRDGRGCRESKTVYPAAFFRKSRHSRKVFKSASLTSDSMAFFTAPSEPISSDNRNNS